MLCYQVFAPFLTLMVWALILAVALYPLHQYLAAKIGGKQGLAATIVVLLGVALIIVPTAVLMSSLGDSVHQLVNDVQENTLEIPAPRESCRDVARGRREALCDLVGGVHRPACSDQEHAAEDRRPREDGARLRCRHWRRASAIPRRLHHRRHPHGLRSGGQPCKPCHLRALRRRRAGRRVHEAGHGDHTGRCTRRHRRRLHSGDHRRPLSAARRHALGGRAGDDRPGTRHRPGARADRHPAGHRLHLVERATTGPSRRSSTPC